MALDDIKKAILDEAKREAEKAKTEGKKEVDKVIKRWSDRVEEKVQDIIITANKKADQKIQQAQLKIKASNQTEILKKKQKIINTIYDQVLGKLKNLSEKEYISLMQKLISKLPDVGGEIISVKGKTKQLEKVLIAAGREYHVSEDTVSGTGGFIFKSEKVDINSTFEALVENLRASSEVEVAKILFTL
ncbi:hypothetical protein KKA15_01965 [Patescibacteria group bacterium]|nr:hypothetical protein [Patescibacteria group bacterium]